MGININMSGAKISGNAKVLNGMTVEGKSNVDINASKTKVTENAEIFNDINTKDANVRINIEEMELGKDVKFMNGKEFSEFKSEDKQEAKTSRQDKQPQRAYEETQETYKQSQKLYEEPQKIYVQPQMVYEETQRTTSKKSLLSKIKEFFTRKTVENDSVDVIVVVKESAHEKFENEISRNGTLKGCTDHVATEKNYEEANIGENEHSEATR